MGADTAAVADVVAPAAVPVAKAPAVNLVAAKAEPAKAEAKTETKADPAKKGPEQHELFLSATFPEDDPLAKGGHTGLPDWKTLLGIIPEPAAKLVHNIRADYTRKTQEFSARDKAQIAEINNLKAELAREKQQVEQLTSPELRAKLEALKKGAEGADPYTREGQAALRKAEAVALFEEMLEPVRQRAAEEAAEAKWSAFVAMNPDIKTPEIRVAVAKLIRDREAAGRPIDLTDAYAIVKGQLAQKQAGRLSADATAAAEERARTLAMTGGGDLASDSTTEPTFTSAVDAYKYLKARGHK